MSTWCNCAERPMCQSRWCDAEASWSVYKPQWPKSNEAAAFQFMCESHYRVFEHGMTTKIKGVDRPEHAPDDWHGSISECIRHAQIAILFSERNNQFPATTHQNFDERFTPAQLAQLRILRSRAAAKGPK